VNYNQYQTPVPKIYQWNVSVQHELERTGYLRLLMSPAMAFNLNFPVDINQVPENRLSSNDQSFRPFHSLGRLAEVQILDLQLQLVQTSIQQRLSSGLSFNFNYTWSHFLNDQDSSSWGAAAARRIGREHTTACKLWQFELRCKESFKGNAIYQLPFGRGRRFLNNNWLLDEAIAAGRPRGTVVIQVEPRSLR